MNFLSRIGDRQHERKDKKLPDRSQSVEPTSSAPLSPTDSSNPRPRRLHDNPSGGGGVAPKTSPAGGPTKDVDWVLAEDMEDNDPGPQLNGKRRTVSISRSGRYKSRSKGRSRILSDDVYSGTTAPTASPSPTSPSLPQPPLAQPQPQPKKKDLVKPSARDKSPARPYIILKTDASVNFAIESTTL